MVGAAAGACVEETDILVPLTTVKVDGVVGMVELLDASDLVAELCDVVGASLDCFIGGPDIDGLPVLVADDADELDSGTVGSLLEACVVDCGCSFPASS